jgi:hypothetical protein
MTLILIGLKCKNDGDFTPLKGCCLLAKTRTRAPTAVTGRFGPSLLLSQGRQELLPSKGVEAARTLDRGALRIGMHSYSRYVHRRTDITPEERVDRTGLSYKSSFT